MLMFLLGGLCCSFGLAQQSSIYKNGWIDFNKNGKKDVYEDPSAPIDERVKNLLSQMTLDEKTCQLATLYGSGHVLKDFAPTDNWKNEIWKDGIANIDEQSNGIVHFGKAAVSYPFSESVKTRQAFQRWFVEETRLGIPVDFTNEGIRGICHTKATMFPAQCGQGATWNRDLIRQIAEVTASEAKVLGYTNIYSPILDLSRDPRWGRVVECYGEDPYLAGELGLQAIRAIQSEGLVSTPKHFAAYSIPVGGRDGDTRTDPNISERAMRSLLLEPFRKGFQEGGAMGVMSSYNDYNGEPIAGSYHFLTEILRHEYGFKGYVVSDSESVEFLQTKHRVVDNPEDGAALAINAGLNVRTHFTPPQAYILPVREAVKHGKISMETIDARVSDVLRVKFRQALFDNPYKGDEVECEKIVHSQKHADLSMQAALQSIVLLKNDTVEKHDRASLPLSKNLKKIAVIGPNADEVDNLICRYGPAQTAIRTPYRSIQSYLPNAEVNYANGCDIIDKYFPESELYDVPLDEEEQAKINQAVELAKNSEVAILVLGGNEKTVRESRSRTSLDLPGRQNQLLKAVYESGTPV
ncbi:MAG: glycoside hydrolase family 3 protein, partial [Candidatus Symbiothrix sp.]|nr:glycoside hydrolase family 3 protein [Candidatus Symbiothrix sp.]